MTTAVLADDFDSDNASADLTYTILVANNGSAKAASPLTVTDNLPTGSVTFYDGAVSLGNASLTGDSAQVARSSLTAGSHTIKAVYSGDNNFKSDSTTMTQVVNQATATLTLNSSLNPSAVGQNVTLKAKADYASRTPTGSVTFYDGTNSLGSVALTGDSAQVSTLSLKRSSSESWQGSAR